MVDPHLPAREDQGTELPGEVVHPVRVHHLEGLGCKLYSAIYVYMGL